MRAATGSQYKEKKRGLKWALLGSLKTSRAAAFWIICRGLIGLWKSSQKSFAVVSLEMTRAWTRSCAACSVRKGLIFLMLCSANLQDRAVFAMCSLKGSLSSKITPRFLTEADGVIVDEPNWIVKSCCRFGVAGKTRQHLWRVVWLSRLQQSWVSPLILITAGAPFYPFFFTQHSLFSMLYFTEEY